MELMGDGKQNKQSIKPHTIKTRGRRLLRFEEAVRFDDGPGMAWGRSGGVIGGLLGGRRRRPMIIGGLAFDDGRQRSGMGGEGRGKTSCEDRSDRGPDVDGLADDELR